MLAADRPRRACRAAGSCRTVARPSRARSSARPRPSRCTRVSRSARASASASACFRRSTGATVGPVALDVLVERRDRRAARRTGSARGRHRRAPRRVAGARSSGSRHGGCRRAPGRVASAADELELGGDLDVVRQDEPAGRHRGVERRGRTCVRSNVVCRSRPRRSPPYGSSAGPETSPFSSIGSVMPLTVSSPLAVTSSPETSIEVAVKRISGYRSASKKSGDAGARSGCRRRRRCSRRQRCPRASRAGVVDDERRGERGNRRAELPDQHVLDREVDGRVGGIRRPGAGGKCGAGGFRVVDMRDSSSKNGTLMQTDASSAFISRRTKSAPRASRRASTRCR